ncbi:small ribosomal subunit protein mS23 [Malaya genurostris]|uniref:small ribosomal subunit protein mS23 n=1 Tax=Malaya genurostris TaxID=325434 RepID=UPI0026F3F992|nr:small ribosomal subunit protein mS23 [Malaya genurostris]
MAKSRLEKIGTIVTRTQGLLRTGAMKWDDRPLWYDIVNAFPPKKEPCYDRPAPNVTLRPIFYTEDQIRAKFHKKIHSNYTVNLADTQNKTPTQRFIEIYCNLETQGALDDERVFEAAQEMLQEQLKEVKRDRGPPSVPNDEVQDSTLVPKGKTVKLQDIFKE